MKGTTVYGSNGMPAAIFLHGGVINRYMWEPVMSHLRDELRCIAIDLPGHGDRRDEDFTVESSIRVLEETMDELALSQAIHVGLSLGGYIAQAMAARRPQRVRGLVLSGSTIRYTGWDGISTRLYGFILPFVSQSAMRTFRSKMREDLGDELADQIIGGGLSARGGAQALRRLPGRDYAAMMAGYKGPIVIANGERDTDNRDGETHFLSNFPLAESIVIKDAGHANALQQPEAYAAAIRQLVSATARNAAGWEK